MMSGGGASIDFFGMEKGSAGNSSSSSSQSQFQKLLQQNNNNNTNGVQTAISKINPQLLKTVIDGKSNFPPLPVYSPIRNGSESSAPGLVSSPLTIFYNGKVCVFDMPHDKAEMIIKIAEEGAVPRKAAAAAESVDPKLSPASTSSMETKALLEKLNGGDLPIARKKSLQRFLEKRKERLVMVSPYANGSESVEEKKMKE